MSCGCDDCGTNIIVVGVPSGVGSHNPSIVTPVLGSGTWVHDDGTGLTRNILSTSFDANNDLTIGTDGGSYFQESLTTLNIVSGDILYVDESGNTTTIPINNFISSDSGNSLTVGGDDLLFINVGTGVGGGNTSIITPILVSGTWIHDDGTGLTNNILSTSFDPNNDLTIGSDGGSFFEETVSTLTFISGDIIFVDESGSSTTIPVTNLISSDSGNDLTVGGDNLLFINVSGSGSGNTSIITPVLASGTWIHDDGTGLTNNILSTSFDAGNVIIPGSDGGSYLAISLDSGNAVAIGSDSGIYVQAGSGLGGLVSLCDLDLDTCFINENSPDEDWIRFSIGIANVKTPAGFINDTNSAYGQGALSSITTKTGDNIGIGKNAAADLTTGTRNIFIGEEVAAFHTQGSRNIAIGENALSLASGGDEGSGFFVNIAIGEEAMKDCGNESQGNIAIGYHALRGAGFWNYIDGWQEGIDGTIAIGASTLENLQEYTIEGNVALGDLALRNLKFGHSITAIGKRAGDGLIGTSDLEQELISGEWVFSGNPDFPCRDNTFVGTNAGGVAIHDIESTVVGHQAGGYHIGSGNTVLGWFANSKTGLDIIPGCTGNTSIGVGSAKDMGGFDNTSLGGFAGTPVGIAIPWAPNSCTFLGVGSWGGKADLTESVAIGPGVGCSGDRQMILGYSLNTTFPELTYQLKVAIGHMDPTTDFHLVRTSNGGFRYQDGNEGINKILTSDADGNAFWEFASGIGGSGGAGENFANTNLQLPGDRTHDINLNDLKFINANSYQYTTAARRGLIINDTMQLLGDLNNSQWVAIDNTTVYLRNFDVKLEPSQANPNTTTQLKFMEGSGNGTNYVGFRAPTALPEDTVWTLPTGDGNTDDVLSTDGAGQLRWLALGSGGAGTNTNFAISDLTLDANRSHDGNAKSFLFDGLSSFDIRTTNDYGIDVDEAIQRFGRLVDGTNSSHIQLDVLGIELLTGGFGGDSVKIKANLSPGILVIYDSGGGGSDHFAGFTVPGNLNTDTILTLPSGYGVAGQVLSTDSNGLLNWINNGSGGVGSSGNSIYSADDTLAGNRIVSGSTNNLSFTNIGTFSVTSTVNNIINTSTSTGGELRFLEGSTNGTNYVGFKSPDLLAGNQTYTLPSGDGTAGQVLSTDGNALLDWVDAGSGGGGSDTSAIQTVTGDYTITSADYTILINASGATVDLPASPTSGDIYNVKQIAVGTNTIDGNGNNIDNSSAAGLSIQYESRTVQFDGSDWWIL